MIAVVPGIRIFIALCLGCLFGCDTATDSPLEVSTANPARPSIVTLAPHLAELVHEAGAGSQLIGVSAYSDYPPVVQSLPVVGDAFLVDQEQIEILMPDLILAWSSGTPDRTVVELEARGFRVEVLQTRSLEDVAAALERIGRLAGTASQAQEAADGFRTAMRTLGQTYADREPIRVFYQISSRPIYTINGAHYISELITLCGGRNIFEDLGELAPMISEEAVLARNPELLLAGSIESDAVDSELLAEWLRWEDLAAVRWQNLSLVDAALVGRATTRLAEAGQAVCAELDKGRERRSEAKG